MILGIGCDLVKDERIGEVITRRGDKFLQRVFTETEIAYCAARKFSAPHYAARFAAKEAMFKALGTGWAQGVGWRDGEIINLPSGEPQLFLHGEAAAVAQRKLAPGAALRVLVTLSHADGYSMAVVVLEQCASC